jgi:hypothetical protein
MILRGLVFLGLVLGSTFAFAGGGERVPVLSPEQVGDLNQQGNAPLYPESVPTQAPPPLQCIPLDNGDWVSVCKGGYGCVKWMACDCRC